MFTYLEGVEITVSPKDIKRYVVPFYRKRVPYRYSNPADQEARKAFYRIVKRNRPESILDVGCGGGFDSKAITALGVRYVGVDPIKGNINRARQMNPDGDFRLGFMQKLRFPDDSFDWVWTIGVWEVLPTVEDMRLGILECMRVARSRVYNVDSAKKPKNFTERYMMVPMRYGLRISRVSYDKPRDCAYLIWRIDVR